MAKSAQESDGAAGEEARSAPNGDVPEDGGQALYLSLMSKRLMGSDDPRAMLEHALRQDQFLLFAQKIVAWNVAPTKAVELVDVPLRMALSHHCGPRRLISFSNSEPGMMP